MNMLEYERRKVTVVIQIIYIERRSKGEVGVCEGVSNTLTDPINPHTDTYHLITTHAILYSHIPTYNNHNTVSIGNDITHNLYFTIINHHHLHL